MEEWYAVVRDLQDESDNWFVIQTITHRIFHDLQTLLPILKKKQRIEKNKDILLKFVQRLGPEFTEWESRLEQEYPSHLVKGIIEDDTFWEKSLQRTGFM